eukprot:TRINITY_DN1297_c0_g1_i1.p1 TRINITY_DN1297_c0_g1~~TRINITY_DN1297_c0_g1_i1.p1  ORF type:complete len:248 (+),score=31.79 TRINITY_DN1297_c0_g1_i1:973-1716(+)
MIGELDDLREFGTWETEYENHTVQASWILTSALCLLATHYLVFRPLGVYNDRDNALVKMYNDVTPPLQPRFRFYFTDWRCYTNIHIVFWCGKDLGWTRLNSVMWVVFMIPTVLVAADFVLITFLHGHILVEHAHYWAYLIWVLGNMIWAMGDEYFAESAVEQQDMWHDPYHWQTMRWWASWTFLMAFVPLIILYVVWIPCSITGKHIGEPHSKEVDKEVPVADDDVTATQQKAALSTPPSAEPLEQA